MGIAALLLAGSNQRPLARTTLASHMTTMTDDRVSGPEETTVARPYAFLFDASADDVPKTALPFFSAAVLSALSEADPDGATRSQFRNGLPSLGQFAARTTAVHAAERSTGRTISYDMDTYKYVVWDWLDSLSEGWSTVDREKGEAIFWRRTEECVALTDLADPLRDEVDRRLHDTPGYVGAFAIDLGNPIHRGGFLDLLSRPAAILEGMVVQERTFEGDEHWALDGAAGFKPGGLVWQPYGWLAAEGPDQPGQQPLSPRGKQAVAALARKHGSTVEGRVIEAIDDAFRLGPARQAFDFKAVGGESDLLEAIMPEGKFTHYLFNPEHEKGGPKSSFFIDVLGIDPEDWRYLAAQFYQGLLMARPENLTLKDWGEGYGMRFNVQMRIRGRSGAEAVVRTGWMLKPGSLPSLSSAMPGDRNADVVDPGEPTILPPGPRTDESWATLWEWASAAGIRALEAVVPTPMYLVGYPPIAEGEMGSAAIRVRDARRGLARWLARSGIGHSDSYGGTVVFDENPGTSLERAVAWARAVALVLKLNGIEAEIEEYSS